MEAVDDVTAGAVDIGVFMPAATLLTLTALPLARATADVVLGTDAELAIVVKLPLAKLDAVVSTEAMGVPADDEPEAVEWLVASAELELAV